MESLGGQDEALDFSPVNDLVQAADGGNAEDPSPFLVLTEDLEQVGLIFERRDARRVGPVRHLENEALSIPDELEPVEHPGGGHERSVGKVREPLAPVDDDPRRVPVAQEVELFRLALVAEGTDGVHVCDLAPLDRNVFLHRLSHPGVQPTQLLRRDPFLIVSRSRKTAIETQAE